MLRKRLANHPHLAMSWPLEGSLREPASPQVKVKSNWSRYYWFVCSISEWKEPCVFNRDFSRTLRRSHTANAWFHRYVHSKLAFFLYLKLWHERKTRQNTPRSDLSAKVVSIFLSCYYLLCDSCVKLSKKVPTFLLYLQSLTHLPYLLVQVP